MESIGRAQSDETAIRIQLRRSGGVLLVAGIIGGERRAGHAGRAALGVDLFGKGKGCAVPVETVRCVRTN
ncbi:MAG: hypothetical protein ACLP4V_23355 [Methylocella sp.]